MSRIMGIDLGMVRVGLAVSDKSRTLASAYGFIQFRGFRDLIEKLKQIAEKEGVVEFVVGLPLNMDGSSGIQAGRAERVAELLKAETGRDVHLLDERLTTVEAARQLHASGRKVKKGRIDEVAATIILQAFLDGKKS